MRMGYGDQLVTMMLKGTFTTMEPTFARRRAELTRQRAQRAAPAAPQAVHHDLARQEGQRDRARTSRQRTDARPQALPAADRDRPQGAAATRSRAPAGHPEQPVRHRLPAAARPQARLRRVRAGGGPDDRTRSASSTSARPGRAWSRVCGTSTFELAWGRSLIEFKPTLTTANQIQSVTVRGWDRTRKEPITRTVDLNDQRLKRQQGPLPVPQRLRRRARRSWSTSRCSPTARRVSGRSRSCTTRPSRSSPPRREGGRAARPAGRARSSSSTAWERGSPGSTSSPAPSTPSAEEGYITTFNCRREQPAGRSSS